MFALKVSTLCYIKSFCCSVFSFSKKIFNDPIKNYCFYYYRFVFINYIILFMLVASKLARIIYTR